MPVAAATVRFDASGLDRRWWPAYGSLLAWALVIAATRVGFTILGASLA